MAGYTSWGTRKALGRRYATDPALLMEMERLQQQYSLAPGREARAIQQSQFDRGLAQQQSQFDATQEANKQAGMYGTIANLGTTGMMMRSLTKGKDEPFFGKTISNAWDKAWGNTPAVNQPVAGYTYPSAELTNEAIQRGIASGADVGVNPATIDANQAIGAGATTTGAAYGSQGGIGTGIGAAESGVGLGLSYLAPVAAGYSGPKLAESVMPGSMENLGHNLSFGLLKGEKDSKTLGKVGAGAAAGAAVGAFGGPVGALAGGVLGGAAALISDIFGW